jgi:hypothetical protein
MEFKIVHFVLVAFSVLSALIPCFLLLGKKEHSRTAHIVWGIADIFAIVATVLLIFFKN